MVQKRSSAEKVLSVLKSYMEIAGPSGYEDMVRAELEKQWKAKMEEWRVDPIGNVLCRVGGHGPKLLLEAHMDEISFVVTSITSDGFIFLEAGQDSRVASPQWRYMVGQSAQVVGRGGVVAEGIFATATGHVLTQSQLDHPSLGFGEFFVDIGVSSRKEAEDLGVHIGASVIWSKSTKLLGSRIVGKALDDRMMLGILALLLDAVDPSLLTCELWYAATVQEENGMHGIKALLAQNTFDMGISLDVGLVGDIPLVEKQAYQTMLGKGATLVHKDKSVYYDKKILWHLADLAKEHDIPIQHAIYRHYNSDASVFIDHGIPAILIGVPTRYTHSSFEMADIGDILNTVALLKALVTTPFAI